MESQSGEFSKRLIEAWPELNSGARAKVVQFFELVVRENEQQNLTRLVSPSDFVDGHVIDVRELLATGFLKYPALDLGSGGGVPGLLAAVVDGQKWILTDSELHKAEFLKRAVSELGVIQSADVFYGRAEAYLRDHKVETVVARAVGKVEKLYGWLKQCSTWNRMVLLKGPGWEEEWAEFQKSRFRRELTLGRTRNYTVGPDRKSRIIVELVRVPRGT